MSKKRRKSAAAEGKVSPAIPAASPNRRLIEIDALATCAMLLCLIVPALSDAWRAGARIVAQVPPHSAVALGELSPDDQVAEVRRLLGTTADVAWLINPDGRFQWVTIRPR